MARPRVLIIGAAGRDFHNFNVLMRTSTDVEVVGFTAAQIPGIGGRTYPKELSGPHYPNGLSIWNEDDLEKVIKEQKVDRCMLAYSDLSHAHVMQLAGRCLAAGADFFLASPQSTMIQSKKPVIAICAVRTGCGKSQTSRYIINILRQQYNLKCAVVRHPMPYGNLAEEAVQRFATYDDLANHGVTIEEREEYEQHIHAGTVVFAGVDYEAILRRAEEEADVVIWDGGNNDTPFYWPDLWICVADPHRAGDELTYYPGDVNFRCADVIVINKANTAPEGSVETVLGHVVEVNPRAKIFITNSEVCVDNPDVIKGRKVVVVEDGPTLTHGGMAYGAGLVAAEKAGAQVVDPRPYLRRSLMMTYRKYPHLGKIVPAMGYWPEQIKDLEATIKAVPADVVVIGTPMDLGKVLKIDKPCAIVKYNVEDRDPPFLREAIKEFVAKEF